MNSILTKSYAAGAAINANRFCKAGASDGAAIQATDASAALLGVSEAIAAASGASVDVIKAGLAYVLLGGTVTRGDHLIPDANGKAVACTIVAGTAQYIGGVAEVSGVDGDIIPILVTAGMAVATATGVVQADVTITTGQLLALNATPKTLVAAPGAGYAIIVEDLQLMYDYTAAAYAGIAAGENLEVRYTNGSGALIATIETVGLLDQTADEYRHVRPKYTTTDDIEAVANAAVIMCLASGEITTGDGPLKVRIRYRTVATSW